MFRPFGQSIFGAMKLGWRKPYSHFSRPRDRKPMNLRKTGGVVVGGACYALAMLPLHHHAGSCTECRGSFSAAAAGEALPFFVWIALCIAGSMILVRVSRVASLVVLAYVALLGAAAGASLGYALSGIEVFRLKDDTGFFYSLGGVVACALFVGAIDMRRMPDTSKVARDRVNEALATIGGALRLFLLYSLPFIFLGTISGIGIYADGPFALFALSHVLFSFMQEAATNLAVFSLSVLGVVCMVAAILWRYLHHRKTIAYFRRKGITDVDGNGCTDTFADKFLDDL